MAESSFPKLQYNMVTRYHSVPLINDNKYVTWLEKIGTYKEQVQRSCIIIAMFQVFMSLNYEVETV